MPTSKMSSLLAYYAEAMIRAHARGAGCAHDCSGRGDCMNGTCLCEIRYTGDECDTHNMPYHACIGGLFLVVSFVCAVQLTICIVTEYRRLKAPTFLRACKVTTQKMLYLVAFLASLIRGAYFVSPSALQESWATSLLSAYYPLLLSGSSLIVCFWAEVFHLRDIRWERPRFLSKSFLAFVTFNLISYSLLAAEVLTTLVADTSAEKKSFYLHVFNGIYAVLIFIVVIFFLIYGVEVFFKVRGEFLKETKVYTVIQPRAGPSSAADDDARDTLVTKQGVQTDLLDGADRRRSVDKSQLQQSRLGLVSQALMLILIAGFLASETLGELWKAKVPVVSRNWHDLVFRIAEIGVALWFPCVLWNSMAPERLWLLNPRRLLSRQLDDASLATLLKLDKIVECRPTYWHRFAVYAVTEYFKALHRYFWRAFLLITFPPKPIEGVAKRSIFEAKTVVTSTVSTGDLEADGSLPSSSFEVLKNNDLNADTTSQVGSVSSGRDCWVCYDGALSEPLIRPCRCTGDVSSVHHSCLSRWLCESAATADGLKCKVCGYPYLVQESNRVEWERGFTTSHWVRTALCVALCVVAGACATVTVQLFQSAVVRVCGAGAALLVCYTALRTLGTNTVTAYQRAKVSSLKILTEPSAEENDQLSTISKSVTVEIASKAVLEKALKGDIPRKMDLEQ